MSGCDLFQKAMAPNSPTRGLKGAIKAHVGSEPWRQRMLQDSPATLLAAERWLATPVTCAKVECFTHPMVIERLGTCLEAAQATEGSIRNRKKHVWIPCVVCGAARRLGNV
jgi:hypothetical protein